MSAVLSRKSVHHPKSIIEYLAALVENRIVVPTIVIPVRISQVRKILNNIERDKTRKLLFTNYSGFARDASCRVVQINNKYTRKYL